MKAIRIERIGGPEVMQLQEIATPVPQEGEVLIQVAAAGVNYADLMQREDVYAVKTTLPKTLGGEIAGTIVALGPGVSHLSDRACTAWPPLGAWSSMAESLPRLLILSVGSFWMATTPLWAIGLPTLCAIVLRRLPERSLISCSTSPPINYTFSSDRPFLWQKRQRPIEP